MKNIFFYLILFFISLNSWSQKIDEAKIDSLKVVLSDKKNTELQRAKTIMQLAEEYQSLEVEKSIEYASKSLVVFKKLNYAPGIADYYRILAKNYNVIEENEKAITCARKASLLYLKYKDTSKYLTTQHILSSSYRNNGNLKKAYQISYNGIKFSNNKKYNFEIANLYVNLAFFSNIENNIKDAILNLEKAEKLFSECNFKFKNIGLLKCYFHRGQIYSKTNQFNKAIEYSLKSLDIAKETNAHENVFSTLYTYTGIAYTNNNNFEKAIYYLKKADQINIKFNNINKRSFNLAMLAEAYFGSKKYTEAIRISNEAIKLVNDNENYFMGFSIIGSSYYELKEYDSALLYQKKALELLDKIEDPNHQRGIYDELSKTYSKLGDYKSALEYSKKFNDLEVKFLNEENTKNVNELEVKFDSNQKDLELKDLTISKQQQKLELLNQKSFNSKLLFVILLTLVVLISVFKSLNNNKKKNKLLRLQNTIISGKIIQVEEQKEKISQSLFERELLLKEIHHRVKNNLQIVISLLNIQAKEGDISNIDDFLEKGQSRINSMVLIHQGLYENENLSRINFNEYIVNLVAELKILLNTKGSVINLDLKSDDVFFDIQTAIPLGLIINELLSNSFKHAFNSQDQGEIAVKIKEIGDNFYELHFSDNGIGYSIENKSKKSLGLELVSLLTKQLKGTVIKNNTMGTSYTISFKEIIS